MRRARGVTSSLGLVCSISSILGSISSNADMDSISEKDRFVIIQEEGEDMEGEAGRAAAHDRSIAVTSFIAFVNTCEKDRLKNKP